MRVRAAAGEIKKAVRRPELAAIRTAARRFLIKKAASAAVYAQSLFGIGTIWRGRAFYSPEFMNSI